jgi:hypothetical protein
MPPQDTSQFFQWLQARLTQKEYAPIGPVHPLDVAFFKHGALNAPYIVAAVDTAHVSNTPVEIFQQVEGWLQKFLGHTGAACLLFVYHGEPGVNTVKAIQGIGGYVTAGAHDLHTGEHWLANHLGWEGEIYGS